MSLYLVVRNKAGEAVCLVTTGAHNPTMLTAISARLGCEPLYYDRRSSNDVLNKAAWDTYREMTGLPAIRAIYCFREDQRWFLSDYHDAVPGKEVA